MSRSEDCIFCKIVAGEIPSDEVFDTESSYAFRDINPVTPTHVLVIPKRHVASIHDLTDADNDELGDLFEVVRRVAEQERVSDGYRVVANVGANAGQSVFHLHLHVMGGRIMEWPPS